MSAPPFYFYLPPGSLTTFELLAIGFKPENDSSPASLSISLDGSTHSFPDVPLENGLYLWPNNDCPSFSDSHSSTFVVNINSTAYPVNLDMLVLVSVDSPASALSEVNNVLVFQFLGGFFARSSDYRMGQLKPGLLRTLGPSRREALQRAVDIYHQSLPPFEEEFRTNFAPLYSQHQQNDELRRAKNAAHYAEYEKSVADTPLLNEEYTVERPPVSKTRAPVEVQKSKMGPPGGSQSLRVVRTAASALSPPALAPQPQVSSARAVFPRLRNGWRSPGTAEIRMCLEELELIFPIDVEKKLFCGLAEDDPDVDAQKVFLFNVIHFLALFSEFTGMIYDVRITMSDGWYRLEERLSGLEIKRDSITSKTLMSNPYRAAVLACLRKITTEFHLQTKHQDFIGCLDSILRFHNMLVDPVDE
jgi:hypothetical protein